ncbi:sigma-54 dependent transcriptional regulator [Pleionea sp. CnH1-48]|uniref:sigma-54-dependent transcriptional regulator n=1 Tax=Pleionea sp. CnH1-48 TaxID=2954494 RepID=UPI0020979C80|nr:sigma-54 dependent transcriptional regulator [Pleionea sp. CnH1-48]MCO7225309.1 sigma-54 dependent transcriptional regulator [Pleionea sp. CnH1-48]
MTEPTALLIDDEPDILELLSMTLLRMGINCHTASNVSEANQKLEKNTYDFCLTDMRLPDGSGLEIVEKIQHLPQEIPVAVLTAHGNMETAIEAMKLGAFDFVSKPVDLSNLRNLVTRALKVNSSQSKQNQFAGGRQFIGSTDCVQRLKQTILKVAKSQAPIYVHGESGTGKEMVARLIHKNGPRTDGPFIAVNCGAIPSELVESEFFGHKKGSFTGASQDKEGLFQAANGGTLFLDEIADLSLSMQVKLLRAIQERAIRSIGSDQEVNVDIRIISASHKDLKALVKDGHFRQDLFYRVNVIEVDVPALRERRDDIPELTNYFLERLAERNNTTKPSITEAALAKLKSYSFPGNIRELENMLERAVTLSVDASIDVADIKIDQSESYHIPQETTVEDIPSLPRRGNKPLEEFLEEVEKNTIMEALAETKGNKTAAAHLLGISFRAMRYRLKKLGLE